jgi:hypothetical protein
LGLLSNLPDCTVASKEVVELFGSDLEREIANKEDAINFRRQAGLTEEVSESRSWVDPGLSRRQDN